MPASAIAAPTRPPTSAWAELEGSPRHQVSRFQSVAASTPEPITSTACAGGTCTIPAIVSATAVPTSSAPSMLNVGREDDRLAGPRASRRDQGGDRVGGVVEPVGQREGDGKGDGEPQFHTGIIPAIRYTRWRPRIRGRQ